MDFKEFILAHDGDDVASLALRRQSLETQVEDWNLALSTLEARSKLRHKVPEWYAIPSLHYPKVLSAEQCSSTETARYKASLVSGKVADLTGGLGVDAWAFSKVATEVLYNEMDEGLCRAAEHNFRELGVKNVLVRNKMVEPGAVKDILGGFEPDTLFLDPARRGDGGRKVFKLEDCSPNVLELLPELYDACPRIILKLSPMADITLICKQLPGVREVHVVATSGECKELLLVMEKGYEGEYRTIIADNGHILEISPLRCASVEMTEELSFRAESEGRSREILFEPGKALLKAGAFDLPFRYGLRKLSRHTHLYVGQQSVPEELAQFGKCFEIVETLPLSGKTMKEVGKRYPKADVTARNIPMTSEELAKRLGVKPGDGSLHIFGTQSDSEGKLLIIARATQREAPVPPRSSRTSA
ncbi:MAG: class I SAM-dependent methyltransferase [Bacteroidales bacterium]|nr:class I SAM-dependent methyltransferase [Bacteroidales bacterium]